MLKKNAFGNLVKAYRQQRGWTQDELAERWGHARAYVSQIERGQRKLKSFDQVIRLADILDIPSEKLEAIGRGIPERKTTVVLSKQADEAILQMLLAPGRDVARLSYLVWVADQQPAIEENLHGLVSRLEQALTSYHGQSMQPAQELLAYTHQMLGRIAYDYLDFASASGHYTEVIDLGQELNNPDIITGGMIRQGSVLRKRGRIESALRCLDAAKPYADAASLDIKGQWYLHTATTYADLGHERGFLNAILPAVEIASHLKPGITSLANEFSLDEVQLSQATGYSELWKPEKALDIYTKTDLLRSFRPLREQGRYLIEKGQAHLYAGNLEVGLDLTLKGLEIASEYRSKRQVGWIEKTYNRLRVQPVGKDKRLHVLRDALAEMKSKQEIW